MAEEIADAAVVLGRYAEGPEQLEEALVGLTEAELDLRLTADTWTIREIVHHIVDGDDLWKTCALAALGNNDGPFVLQWYWDRPQTEWAAHWRYASRSIEPMLALFQANRQHIVELVQQTPGAWDKSIRMKAPNGEEQRVSVGDVIDGQADHTLGHIADIEAIRCAHQRSLRKMLELLGQNSGEVSAAIALALRFEGYLRQLGKTPSADTAWSFSRVLIQEGSNTRANYMALIRYCRFVRRDEMMVAFLELVDGGEVAGNLYQRVGERFGPAVRDEIFAGVGIAPYGTPSPEKPAYILPVVQRLERRVGEEACSEFLSACLRDLPDDHFLPEREKYLRAADIDAYLRQRKDAFIAELEECKRAGRPFFAQEITEDVIDFVRRDPEMGGGRRVDNVIYETKIPYMTQKYLGEADPRLKRYYACHCPWARDAIRKGDVELAPVFCQCSGGFHKKPLEVALQRHLKVEVLESALKGDARCRFAIYLPADMSSGDER